MLRPGDDAPPFALPDQDGNQVSLAALLAGGPLVLYFYPADFTPVCTREACLFRDAHGELLAAGFQVAGVSPQGPATHARFRDRHRLPFPLLADPEKRVIRAYGAAALGGLWVRRVSYLIDPAGRILDAERADLRVGRHAGFVARVLARRPGE